MIKVRSRNFQFGSHTVRKGDATRYRQVREVSNPAGSLGEFVREEEEVEKKRFKEL